MKDITWPYLLMHGSADKIVSTEGSEMLHSRSKSEDKTFKIYEGYFHGLLNEPKEFSDIVKSDIES
jgi:acylglycerol lipase